jgi:hypothetical protein
MKKHCRTLLDAIDHFFETDLSDINWVYKIAPEKWSKKEIMGHLIDSAQINLQRFVRCTYQENFKLRYNQVEWVEAGHYQQADITELLPLWKLLNLQIVRVISGFPAERLQIQCDTGRDSINLHTAEWLMQDYVEHLNHHLIQILQS